LIGSQVVIPMHSKITATELYNRVNTAHVELIKKVLPLLISGSTNFEIQDESRATKWPGRKPEDGEIDLNGSVHEAECLIRAVTRPYPGAFFFEDRKKVIVWKAAVVNQRTDKKTLIFRDGVLALIDFDEIKL
jgi:methionyl-tRNA formyltransferase